MNLTRTLPNGFVFLTDIDPTITENSRYYTHHNFLAKPVSGYNTPRLICTKEAASNLKEANASLKKMGINLSCTMLIDPNPLLMNLKDGVKVTTIKKRKGITTLLLTKKIFSKMAILLRNQAIVVVALLI